VADALTADEMHCAISRIAAWRVDPEKPVRCLRCGREGLGIIDRSARPYAEWYQLNCAACGLDATLNVPLGPPFMGGLD
jgi:transcription elongation factor Elf1